MSTDPFDEAPHDPHGNNRPILPAIVHRQTASSSEGNGFAASCVSPHNPKGSPAALSPKGPANFGRNDPHHSTERAVPHTDVLHRRGMSVDHSLDSTSLVPPALHHPRTRSSDIDDHMAGSVYAPHEICPKCGFARSSSIFCHVTKMHHGTDEPLQEAKPKGFFARLRGASNSDDDQPAGEALASGAEPSADQLPTDRPATVDDASPTPKKKGWSIFKSKEEKQVIALEDEEEEARKKLVKSRSNPDGEKDAYELLQAAFEQGVKDIHKRDKARHAMCKTETEARDDIETAEEKGRKEWTKDEAKARKKLPASCHVLAPSSSGTLSAQPSAGSMGSPANHTGDVGTPCADGEGASVQSHP